MTTPTTEALASARAWLGIVYEDADFPNPKLRPRILPHDDDRRTCIQVLDAHKRVIAFIESLEKLAQNNDAAGAQYVAKAFAAQLRLTLEGGKQ